MLKTFVCTCHSEIKKFSANWIAFDFTIASRGSPSTNYDFTTKTFILTLIFHPFCTNKLKNSRRHLGLPVGTIILSVTILRKSLSNRANYKLFSWKTSTQTEQHTICCNFNASTFLPRNKIDLLCSLSETGIFISWDTNIILKSSKATVTFVLLA